MRHPEVVCMPIEALKAYDRNPRTISAEALKGLAASIRRFGLVDLPVFNRRSGHLVSGHQRVRILRESGETVIDVLVGEWDETEERAMNLALNSPAIQGEFVEEELAKLLAEAEAADKEAFDELRLGELGEFAGAKEGQSDPDDAPEPEPVTVISEPGDLWILGDHRLLCGDSRKGEDVARVLAGEKAALWATDPPYCVDYTGDNRPIHDGKRTGKDWSSQYHEIDVKDFGAFLEGAMDAALPHLREDAPIYLWHAHVQQHVVFRVWEARGILFHQVIVWAKPGGVFGHAYYQWQHEPCAFGWRQGHRPTHGSQQLTTLWTVDWEGKKRIVGNDHPTQKPTRLFEIPIEVHTAIGDPVLESFSGSRSNLIACERLRRRCRAIEIEPVFVDVAVRRWEAFTGQKARPEAGKEMPP